MFPVSKPRTIALLLVCALAFPTWVQQISLPYRPQNVSKCPPVWSPQQTIAPSKVVVQPWKGRHHIYAEFQLPAGTVVGDLVRLNMGEAGDFCGGVTEVAAVGNLGTTTAIARMRTRTALWLMLQGKMGDLNRAANWQLPISG